MGYVRQKWWMKLMSLFEEMKHKNMIPDIVTYNSLVDWCAKLLESSGEIVKYKGICISNPFQEEVKAR